MSQICALKEVLENAGLYVLAGSAADAVSYESTVYWQGLLTSALLRGMNGEALRRDVAEDFIDVRTLFEYAERKVPQLAEGIGGIQRPFYRPSHAQGEDPRGFSIGRVTEDVKRQICIAEHKPVLIVKGFQDEDFDDQLSVKAALKAHLST